MLRIEACITEIKSWLAHNMPKLNCDETEVLVFTTPHQHCLSMESIQVASERIKPSHSTKNIGVIFDQHMYLDQHVANNMQSFFLSLT